MMSVTLIELVIALVVLAVMIIIVVYLFQQYRAKAKLREVAQQITAEFAYYRNKARLEGRRYKITFNSPNTYRISAAAARQLRAVNVTKKLPESTSAAVLTDVDLIGNSTVRLTQQGLHGHFYITPSLRIILNRKSEKQLRSFSVGDRQ